MEHPARVSLVPTPTGLSSLRVRKAQGGFLSVHSMHDPWEEACRFAESVPLKDDSALVVVLGVGLGYHVLALAYRMLSAGHRAALWAVELDDDLLDACIKNVDLGLLLKLDEGRLLSKRSLGFLTALEQAPAGFEVQCVRYPAACALDPAAYAPWESALEELSARRRLSVRAPGVLRWLSGLQATPVLNVRAAAARVLETGPPYGHEEAALLLLDRVHSYE